MVVIWTAADADDDDVFGITVSMPSTGLVEKWTDTHQVIHINEISILRLFYFSLNFYSFVVIGSFLFDNPAIYFQYEWNAN